MVLILAILMATNSLACNYWPPFAPKKSYRIIQGFYGKYSHKKPLQYGIDFDMPEGTLIYSARAGKISEIIMNFKVGGPDKKYLKKSNKIIIDHGDNTFSLYAHLKKLSSRVTKGQIITVGHPIARSACTGWCDGAHLHFEVFKKDLKTKRISIPFKFKGDLGCSLPKFGSQVTNQFIERRNH